MAKAACKCKPTECEECPEWIFTFADLVMLMMGFFVILWVTKPGGAPIAGGSTDAQGEHQWAQTVEEIRKAFGYVPDAKGMDQIDKMAAEIQRPPKGSHDRPYQSPGAGGETTEPRKSAEGTDSLVTNVRPGNHVSVGGKLLFDPGESRLTPQTSRTLDEIATLIKGYSELVVVKGHASLAEIPERADLSDQDRSGQLMALSLHRAEAAAAYLISKGVRKNVIRIQGCSTFESIARGYTPDAQAPNRRVEVEVTDQLVNERQTAPTTVPALVPPPIPGE